MLWSELICEQAETDIYIYFSLFNFFFKDTVSQLILWCDTVYLQGRQIPWQSIKGGKTPTSAGISNIKQIELGFDPHPWAACHVSLMECIESPVVHGVIRL